MESTFYSSNSSEAINSPPSQSTTNDLTSSVTITQISNEVDEPNDNGIHHSSNTTTVTNSITPSTQESNTTEYYFDVPVKSDEFIKCYQHLGTPKLVFPFSCQKFTDLRPEACKFRDRGCIVKSWNLASKNVQDKFVKSSSSIQPEQTVFPVPTSKQKNNGLFLADTKLITCSNPSCIKIDEDGNEIPTVFHYCCYVNMRVLQEFNDLEYDDELDKLGPAQNEIVKKLRTKYVGKQTIILPVCRKGCYNKILKNRKMVENENKNIDSSKKSSNTRSRKKNITSNRNSVAGNLRWNSDSKEGSRSSEEILVHWLTDEENAEKYFGGNHGSKNQVNGIRKDMYHSQISRLIFEENGKEKYICNIYSIYFTTHRHVFLTLL